jgi:hypothetical protein
MRKSLAIISLAIAACGVNDAGRGPLAPKPSWVLSLEPQAELEQAQPVVAMVLSSDIEEEPPADVILVEGEPSKISTGKYMGGETTEALLERTIPTRLEKSAKRLVLRPVNVLLRGQRYTVLSRAGVLGSIAVRPAVELAYLSRVWPPRDSVERALQTIYCGDAAPTDAATIRLFPSELVATIEPGLDSDGRGSGSCVRILPDVETGQAVQPPTNWGNFAFEPTPWDPGAELAEIQPLACAADETNLGPGCLATGGGSGLVRAPASSTLWVLESSLGWHTQEVEADGRFAVPGIEQLSDGHINALVFDLAGRSFFGTAVIEPPMPSAHVIINEVMANPRGPEPAEEWIELTNAGAAAAEMRGWKLRDQSGAVEIPPLILEPSAIVLLVRRDFEGGVSGDVPPAPDTALVRLPSLGKNGLSNAGEPLLLLDDNDVVVSSFPGRASEREGVSQARRSPFELDDAPNGFGPHASPGASPGSTNVVE